MRLVRHGETLPYDEALTNKSKDRHSVIVFDLGNTLIRFDHNISARKIANLFHLDSEKIYEAFFDSEMTQAFEKGLISPHGFHIKACRLLGIKMPFKDFKAIWNDIFWEDKRMCDIARKLKKTHRLFLLSNVNSLHFEHIREKFDIIKIFDEVILSFMVGAIKPDRIIFEDVVRRAGGDRRQLLYIDDREDLVREARLLGIDSIRFEGAENLEKTLNDMNILS